MATVVSLFPFLFKGRLGNVTGHIRNGKQYIKRRAGKRTGENLMAVPGRLIYTWETDEDSIHLSSDNIILLLYSPSAHKCVVCYPENNLHTGCALFDTSKLDRHKMHVSVCMLSIDKKIGSGSKYLGEISLG